MINNVYACLQILTPFLLRRVKSDVDLKIPPKKEVLVYCPMSSKQHDMYEAIVNKTISDLLVKVFFSHFFTLIITYLLLFLILLK